MFTAIALFIALVGRDTAPLPDACELNYSIPGKTTSRSCASCHDGSIAAEANVIFPSTLPGFESPPHDPGSGAHPVDIDYQLAALRMPGSFTPMGALPRELVLQNGLVNCVTCHHPDSGERFRTSLTMDKSALCFACHRY